MQYGIDVSQWQGKINWKAVKRSGVQFAMLRAVSTNSGGLYADLQFEYNYQQCVTEKIPVGVYYYTCAKTKTAADRELELLKKVVMNKRFDYPVVMDVEDKSLQKLTSQQLTDLALYALKKIESQKYYAMLYSYSWFCENQLQMQRLSAFDLWLADYRGRPPVRSHGIWQYSSSGQVAGIQGKTDLNRAYKDYPAVIAAAGLNGFAKQQPEERYKLSLGWISQGDYRAAQNALKPVIEARSLESYYSEEKCLEYGL